MEDINRVEQIYKENIEKLNQYNNLDLNMARGKPNTLQLDLSNPLFDLLTSKSNFKGAQDYRNYGILDGIPEAKKLFSELISVQPEEIMILGNSSLNIMYDTLQRAMQFGVCGNEPFNKQGKIKWLCPAPGYDRHFAITEHFGIEMINIKMNSDGPDMDAIYEYIKDPQVKGIWCVPKFSNPQGIVYSDEVVRKFAQMKPAAKDFRIYWDNAYCVHYIYKDVKLLSILEEAKKYGNEDIVYQFGSTSKITFPGSGISWVSASQKNLKDFKLHMQFQTIGYNKINQLAHVNFLKSVDGVYDHMAKHAEILKPHFDIVLNVLEKELKSLCNWTKPNGGYFISIDLPNNTAKRAVELAKEHGVVMTGAGATYPYKKDPNDSNIRIAPTLPSEEELKIAMEVFCACVKVAWAETKLKK
ncbi:MAG: aminotransferase [Clostridia bacterium]|nr:aminotransferase [Clostridia bacterium]